MIPVDQTTFGKDVGNCYSAALASILEIPIDSVPFMGGSSDWIRKTNLWLRTLGLTMLEIEWPGTVCHIDDTYVIGTGQSPRGDFLHSMVCTACVRKGRIEFRFAHDPHPSRANILDLTKVGFLVPTARGRFALPPTFPIIDHEPFGLAAVGE